MSGDESLAIEVSKLLDKAKELGREEREALNYFLENISVGSIRAVKELKLSGRVKDPVNVIRKLIAMGFLEDAGECYNLAKPLREYILTRGKLRL